MASTKKIQDAINWAQAFALYTPLALGNGNEPAITSANVILQTILRPPFAWRWNRATVNFTVQAQSQDVKISLPAFGFVEKASLQASGGLFELGVKPVLGDASETSRPKSIAAQLDDGAGNITFRFLPVPDVAYNVTVVYQEKAPLVTSLSSSWTPVPDELGHLYNAGFLGYAMLLQDDARAAYFLQRFAVALIGESEGLDETQKNLFLQHWLDMARMQQSGQARAQAGATARSS